MNCATRLISDIGRYDHVTPVMKSLHWLPSEDQIHYKILCLTFNILNDLTSDFLYNDIIHYELV